MPDPTTSDIPQSPENQPAEVRDELDQTLITHEGTPRPAAGNPDGDDDYMGATETDVTPVTPLTTGPLDFIGDEPEGEDVAGIDPRDEIPGG